MKLFEKSTQKQLMKYQMPKWYKKKFRLLKNTQKLQLIFLHEQKFTKPISFIQ